MRPRAQHHRVVAATCAVLALALSACDATAQASSHRRDPHTIAALLAIARRFNAEYAANDDAPVYDRFDAASRAVIDRRTYLRRHRECPSAPGRAVVLFATPASHGEVAVHDEISGVPLTDYWHYLGGHWRFDLRRSNPDAVRLYRLPAARYFAAVGCASLH